MKSFNLICSFFISCVISWSHSSSDSSGVPPNGLGTALCDVWASFNSTCGIPDVPVECFPPECSSFFYGPVDLTNGTAVDLTVGTYPEGYLDSLLSLKKLVIIWIVHESWPIALKCMEQNGAETEMASLKSFIDEHKGITGIALYKTELDTIDNADPEYTQKLVTYIGILKKNFPDLKFGLYLDSGTIINTLDTEQLKSLDYACINQNVDFFRMLSVKVGDIDECVSQKFKHGEDVMNKFNKAVLDYISGFNISKDKIVWDVWGTPSNSNNYTVCELTYGNMCSNPDGTYCATTQQGFYDKGKNIKEIAGGFALNFIDTDDINCCCLCRKFPVFYALWDGFNGNPAPEECSLFDRP